jgi:transketolase
LDSLSRTMLQDGSLARRIQAQGLAGVTTNPAIFHRAIAGSVDYDERVREAVGKGRSVEQIYRDLILGDVAEACDLLQPLYEETQGGDGYVSVEVSPHLAHDVAGSLREASVLWNTLDRRNLMIKIPGTVAGIAAAEELLYRGINVNVTLLFGLKAYWETFQAFLRAFERRLDEGRPLAPVASVASFFLSRMDSAVDGLLRQRMAEAGPLGDDEAQALLGRTAVAKAKLAYASMQAFLASDRWRRLEARGARPQRLVWASTGTKDPAYRDVMYIEPLIGPHTVSTMPEATADAFDEHGRVEATLESGLAEARAVMNGLERLGIDLGVVGRRLVDEGIAKFVEPYDALLALLGERSAAVADSRNRGGLKDIADRLRAAVIRMTTVAGSGHPTSALSSAEIMAVLFFDEMRWDPADPAARDVDRFILSKGHAAPVLWAALHEAGAIDEDLSGLRRIDSSLEGHPTPANPWVQVATGSLGQGLAAANGMALADRMEGIDARVYCLMGDGECSEGAVWEAAQFASLHGLSSLVAIVDVNGLEQSGPAPCGSDTSILAGRFRAFGWRTLEVDGHDVAALQAVLRQARDAGPCAILARTIKGKGVSFLEGARGWHGKALSEQQSGRALAEIGEPSVDRRVEARHVGRRQRSGAPVYTSFSLDYRRGDQVATRAAFGDALLALGSRLPELVVLDGDVKNSTKTEGFAEAFPERFFEAHIAEQNMVGAALGLAVSGKLPVAATFAAFLSRAFDFIRMAGHTRPPHLVLCGSHAGVSVGEDGPSQMGLEDLAMFRAVDGCTVLCPSDAVSAARLTELAVLTDGIVYLRTTRGETPVLYDPTETFEVGGSKVLVSSAADRVTLVAAGVTVPIALEAQQVLAGRGLNARVVDAYSVEPLDVKTLEAAARETGTLLVIEDHNRHGGLGEAVSSQIGRLGRVFRMGITGEPHSGSPRELFERHHISTDAVVREASAVAA